METFKWLIVTSSRIMSGLMIFVLVFSFYNGTSEQTTNLIITFIVAVIFAAFSWYYDALLKRLDPQNKSNKE
jgi:hypothetical protein